MIPQPSTSYSIPSLPAYADQRPPYQPTSLPMTLPPTNRLAYPANPIGALSLTHPQSLIQAGINPMTGDFNLLTLLNNLNHLYKSQKKESPIADITVKRGALVGAILLGAPTFLAKGLSGAFWGAITGAVAGGSITALLRKKKPATPPPSKQYSTYA